MFRCSEIHSPNITNKEKMSSSDESLPIDFTVLSIKPSPIEELTALGRPSGLKHPKSAVTRSIDEEDENDKIKNPKEKLKNRIGADSSKFFLIHLINVCYLKTDF